MNVACPLAFVVPLTVVIVELPLPAVRETVLPFTTFPPESLRVTVTVDVVDPSAVTDVGLAVTVEAPALTGPALNTTVIVWDVLFMVNLQVRLPVVHPETMV